jgi:hypothetical protein
VSYAAVGVSYDTLFMLFFSGYSQYLWENAKLGSIAIGKALLVDKIMDRNSYRTHKLILYESLLVTHRVQRSIVKKPLKIKGTIDSAL